MVVSMKENGGYFSPETQMRATFSLIASVLLEVTSIALIHAPQHPVTDIVKYGSFFVGSAAFAIPVGFGLYHRFKK